VRWGALLRNETDRACDPAAQNNGAQCLREGVVLWDLDFFEFTRHALPSCLFLNDADATATTTRLGLKSETVQ